MLSLSAAGGSVSTDKGNDGVLLKQNRMASKVTSLSSLVCRVPFHKKKRGCSSRSSSTTRLSFLRLIFRPYRTLGKTSLDGSFLQTLSVNKSWPPVFHFPLSTTHFWRTGMPFILIWNPTSSFVPPAPTATYSKTAAHRAGCVVE